MFKYCKIWNQELDFKHVSKLHKKMGKFYDLIVLKN
jgi:hypothetical protein